MCLLQQLCRATTSQGHGVCRDDYPAADFGRWSLTAEILKKQFTKYFYGHHALGILDKVSDDTPFSPKICVSAGLETLLQSVLQVARVA